jgi:hypothetical protein
MALGWSLRNEIPSPTGSAMVVEEDQRRLLTSDLSVAEIGPSTLSLGTVRDMLNSKPVSESL